MREIAVCTRSAGLKIIKPIAVGSRVTRAPEQHCDDKRRMTRMCPPIPGLWAPYTHRNCTCNEYVALRNRVIGAVPRPTAAGIKLLKAEAAYLVRQLPRTTAMSREAFCEHYSGRRKTRYLQAVESLELKALDLPREARISAFVKSEKFAPSAKVNPDPRMIQARSPRFNVEIGVFLKPIEHHLYRLRDGEGFPMVAKGMAPWDRGYWINRMWSCFDRPVAVILDGARWDQHVATPVLRVGHWVYLQCCNDPWFKRLLKCQLKNKCRTSNGWRYVANGCRMSGDMDTAAGNCLLMILMICAICRKLGIRYKICDDGDDVVVIIDERDLDRFMAEVSPMFLSFGQEVKVESIARRMEDIDFCQARPVKTNTGGYTMLPNWRKVVSQGTAGVRYWAEPKTRIDMAYSVGQCLMALYPGMPIIQTYASVLCREGRFNRSILDTDWMFKVLPTGRVRELGTLGPEVVTMETRVSFMQAYGLTPEEQMVIEAKLLQWELPVGLHDVPQPVSGEWEWNHCLCHDPTLRVS